MKGAGRLLRERRGAAALEFALLGLPFVLLLLGLMEFGRGLYIRSALDALADRVQRAILIDPSATTETLEAEIRGVFGAGRAERLALASHTVAESGDSYRLVALTYEMDLLLPAPLGGPIAIRSTRRVAIVD